MDNNDNTDRFRDEPCFDNSVGSDLTRIAQQLEANRDFLLGLNRFVGITKETIHDMACVEEAVQELLSKRWNECQETLESAHEDDLHELDTEWMGRDMPSFFRNVTVDDVRGMMAKAREIRRPQANPATLIHQGVL